jgi:hypothetical protein
VCVCVARGCNCSPNRPSVLNHPFIGAESSTLSHRCFLLAKPQFGLTLEQ